MRLYDYFSSFERVPAVPIVGYPVLVSQNLDTHDCLMDPEKHAKVVEYVKTELDIDALLPLLDLTVEAEALGATVNYHGHDPPEIQSTVDVDNILRVQRCGKIPAMLKTAKKMLSLANDLLVGFFVTGPFTATGQTIGLERLLKLILREPDKLLQLIQIVTEICFEYAKDLEDAGVDFIVIADPSSSLVSKAQFEEFSKPYLTQISKGLTIDSVLHVCGRSKHLLEDMVETGAAAISIDQNISLEHAVSATPKDVIIFGNYDPAKLLVEDPLTIRKKVIDMLTSVKHRRNVVSSTGCDVPPKTPLENVKIFIQTSKSIMR